LDQDLVNEAQGRLADWESKAHVWYVTYYVLGISSTVFVITAASKPPFLAAPEIGATIIWLAAILQGLNTYLLTIQKGAAYRAAWRILKGELVKYKNSSQKDADVVVAAMEEGWQLIDKGYSKGATNA
jgi:hypothetical protein